MNSNKLTKEEHSTSSRNIFSKQKLPIPKKDIKPLRIEQKIDHVLLRNNCDLLAAICQTSFVGNTAQTVSIGVLALLRQSKQGVTETFLKRLLASRVEEYCIEFLI